MGYHRMTAELLGAIWTRLREGISRRGIAEALGLDKKTVNQYAERIEQAGIPRDASLSQALAILTGLLDGNRKGQPALAVFEPLRDDIRHLIQGDRETHRQPMKAKTAWLVLKDLYSLGPRTSYESFKRFCRREGFSGPPSKPVARIETEPGEEVQLDYAHMGPWMVLDRRRTVYAYLGILSHSRLPYLEFCTSQDEASFAGSTQRLFHFFGGAVRRVNPDNLKAGVLSADIYDPVLNRLRTAGRLLKLREPYGDQRLEAACAKALYYDEPVYATVKRILAGNLEAVPSNVAPVTLQPARTFVRTASELLGHLFRGAAWT